MCNLAPDTLLATVLFPCRHLRLHKVSIDMLKHAKTFEQDSLHANHHETVTRYFAAEARQNADKVVSTVSHMLDNKATNTPPPDIPDGHQASADNKETIVVGHEPPKEPLSADEVAKFSNALCPAQIITTLVQSLVHLKVNQLSQLQQTDLVLNRIFSKRHSL